MTDPETCSRGVGPIAKTLTAYDRLLTWLVNHVSIPESRFEYIGVGLDGPEVHHNMGDGFYHIAGVAVNTCLWCLTDFMDND